ncbi:MAG: hypothetical protein EB033_13610 [Proteobacteria bacterium]|nr:hypothetical protein [Pseudomonadota bacterium]NDG99003.1 hypothetical protein [Pseudomonadota bacterium]
MTEVGVAVVLKPGIPFAPRFRGQAHDEFLDPVIRKMRELAKRLRQRIIRGHRDTQCIEQPPRGHWPPNWWMFIPLHNRRVPDTRWHHLAFTGASCLVKVKGSQGTPSLGREATHAGCRCRHWAFLIVRWLR